MAKKKPTKPTKSHKSTSPSTTVKPRSASRAAVKPVDTARERVLETENAPTVETGPAPAREVGALTGIEIGHVAGDVWGVLTREGPLTIAALKKEVKAPGDVVAAAIGWLAREEKLMFDTAGRVVKISLR